MVSAVKRHDIMHILIGVDFLFHLMRSPNVGIVTKVTQADETAYDAALRLAREILPQGIVP